MDNLHCAAMRDLLPLYAESLTEDDTNLLIAAHLASCENCARCYAQGVTSFELPRVSPSKADRKTIRAMRLKLLWYLFWPMLYAISLQFNWPSWRVTSLLLLAFSIIFIPSSYIGYDTYFDDDKRRDYYKRRTSPFWQAVFLAIPVLVPLIFIAIDFVIHYRG